MVEAKPIEPASCTQRPPSRKEDPMDRALNFAFGISLLIVSVGWAYATFRYIHSILA